MPRPARPDEESGIWELAASVYPGYSLYGERASHRRIRVFVLERPLDPIGSRGAALQIEVKHMAERTQLMVWIDQDLCTGDGICEEITPMCSSARTTVCG